MKKGTAIFLMACLLFMLSACCTKNTWQNRRFVVNVGNNAQILIPIEDQEFEMGANFQDPPLISYGKVRLGYGFWIGKHEISVTDFKFYQNETGVKTVSDRSGTAYSLEFGDGVEVKRMINRTNGKLPVSCVTWAEADAYCKWLNGKIEGIPSGYELRLPTEAEWERACVRGFSRKVIDKVCWSRQNSGGRTQPIGTREADAHGLHDMLGNVAEWCLDWSAEYGDIFVPIGPDHGVGKIARGGSYLDDDMACNSFWRIHVDPSKPYIDIGFRVVIAPKVETLVRERKRILESYGKDGADDEGDLRR